MSRLMALLGALALLSAPALGDEADDAQRLFDRMVTAMDAGDSELAWRTSLILLEHEDLNQLPTFLLAEVYGAAGVAAFFYDGDQMDRAEAAALERFDEAVRLGVRNPVVFLFRGLLHASRERAEPAARDILQAEQLMPGIANDLRTDMIGPILFGLRQDGLEPLHAEFVAHFYANWRPAHPMDLRDGIIVEAARVALRAGDLQGARDRVGELSQAGALEIVQTHREFDALWIEPGPELQARLREATQGEAERYAALAEAHRDHIEPRLMQADAHARLGDYEAAYALALETHAQALDGAFPADTQEQFGMLLANLASYELGLGRLDDALERLRRASTISEYGVDNVTQRLSLAGLLVAAARPEEALEVIEGYEALTLTSHGEGAALSTRACALHQLGDHQGRDRDVEALREDFASRAGALQFVYACLDDRDAAAALLIERLADPRQRLVALDELIERDSVATEYEGPLDAMFDAHDEALLARPEVQAAIAEAGRVIKPGTYY
ncbi:MAG: hypothetical protein ACLFQ5_08610 [Oceanicaulis sp.]